MSESSETNVGNTKCGCSMESSASPIADHFAPRPADIVGTPYAARKLACTTVWITDLIRRGEIPDGGGVPGTGNGKIWKLYRRKIDNWIETR